MKKRGLAAKSSAALSLIVFTIVLMAAAERRGAVPERPVPVSKVEVAEHPEEVEGATPSAQVILPPPPEFARELETAAPPNEKPAPIQKVEAVPPRVVEALRPAPPRSRPETGSVVTALQPAPKPIAAPTRPEAEPPQPEPQQVEPAPRATAKESARPSVAATAPVEPGEEVVTEGRTLLRLLEHGSGPMIELAWPDPATVRGRLFDRLRSCFGMRVALLDEAGRVFIAGGQPGTPWELNRDRFSGFVRSPAGRLSAAERKAVAAIRRYHGAVPGGRPVRVFPRHVDALLLGGLRQLVGEDYRDAGSIRARYRLDGSRLFVEGVVADGQTLPGRIDLSPTAEKPCRRAG